jgi:hypothetical protein
MAKGGSTRNKHTAKKMTATQVVFIIISVIIVISFVLSLLQ